MAWAPGTVRLSEFCTEFLPPTNDLPYSRQELIRAFERLLVTSQGLQYWWKRVRYVYSWEDPWSTTKWFLLYLVFLKTGRVLHDVLLLLASLFIRIKHGREA